MSEIPASVSEDKVAEAVEDVQCDADGCNTMSVVDSRYCRQHMDREEGDA